MTLSFSINPLNAKATYMSSESSMPKRHMCRFTGSMPKRHICRFGDNHDIYISHVYALTNNQQNNFSRLNEGSLRAVSDVILYLTSFACRYDVIISAQSKVESFDSSGSFGDTLVLRTI